jgi:hypothetical protein
MIEMCRGLAVIATERNEKIELYAMREESSHDKLLHMLDDDLRLGKYPHIKFEILYPRNIVPDICNDVDDYYPDGWLINEWGKKRPAEKFFQAVEKFLSENPENLLNFTKSMLQGADLSYADLSDAWIWKIIFPDGVLTEAEQKVNERGGRIRVG